MLTLDLAVVTYRPEGLQRVAAMLAPPMDGVRYVVSWQQHENAPIPQELTGRTDVEIHRFDGVGISTNRNNAIAHCKADIILFADDDLVLFPDGLTELRKVFEEKPTVDLATFMSIQGSGVRYPENAVRLHTKLPKGYWIISVEIAFRRQSAGFLRCCPELGLGSPGLHGGEDEMIVRSAIKRGLNCHFFPIKICAHPHPSTGTKSNLSPGNLRASGCIIALSHPASCLLRIPLKAWRLRRQGQKNILRSLWHLYAGVFMAPGVLRRNHNTLW